MVTVDEECDSWSVDEEPNVNVCKFCLCEQGDENELLHNVCDCDGSLGYVHASCLVNWQIFRRKGASSWECELCRSPIRWPIKCSISLVEILAETKNDVTSTKDPLPSNTPPSPQQSQWQRLKRHLSRYTSRALHVCSSSYPISFYKNRRTVTSSIAPNS